jgi:hypothetical protein
MMRKVTIIVEVDPSKYEDTEDSADGALEIIKAAIDGEADFPQDYSLACELVKQVITRHHGVE